MLTSPRNMKKILITGSGGREHAIAKSIQSKNPHCRFYFFKGNGGTAAIGENINHLSSQKELLQFAKDNHIDITIVGSEDLLVSRIVDDFKKNGLAIFGPHQAAAMLEGSKVFAKSFMKKHGIRTASYDTFTSFQEAALFVKKIQHFPIVIKASGLAAGKGVKIAHHLEEALLFLAEVMKEKIFGAAGEHIVIEEFLDGFEVSVLSLFNGTKIYPWLAAKDHKQLLDGGKGENTGGMGVVAPHPLVDKVWWDEFERNILIPTEQGLIKDNMLFAGVIFFGLMCTAKGIYLLEYNMRLGDPETQALLPLLESNLLEHIENAIEGKPINMQWSSNHSCCVVLASQGYPKQYEKHKKISGLPELGIEYFIAGAEKKEAELLTTGGRVMNVVAVAATLAEARNKAYQEIKKINFDGMYFRKDIGLN